MYVFNTFIAQINLGNYAVIVAATFKNIFLDVSLCSCVKPCEDVGCSSAAPPSGHHCK